MSNAIGLSALLVAGVVLGRRWPVILRRGIRACAYITGLGLLFVLASGIGHAWGVTGTIHRWLPHGLFIWAWNVTPVAVGVALAESWRRPVVAAGRAVLPMALLGGLFLGSLSGYLGPSRGQVDPASLVRFRVMHFALFPTLAALLVVAWFYDLRPGRANVSTPPVPEAS